MLRLVVADDNLLARAGLVALLSEEPGVQVEAVAGTLDELLREAARVCPDVVVTDIRMPPDASDEGLRAAAALRETQPDVGVVILSQHAEVEYALALLEDGSAGRAYLLKERLSRPQQLVDAITEVAEGGSVIDPAIVELLVSARTRQERSVLRDLTERELAVLESMARGQSNAGIGQSLHLSAGAVEKHITSLFMKLGLAAEPDVHRRVRAVLLFLGERD